MSHAAMKQPAYLRCPPLYPIGQSVQYTDHATTASGTGVVVQVRRHRRKYARHYLVAWDEGGRSWERRWNLVPR